MGSNLARCRSAEPRARIFEKWTLRVDIFAQCVLAAHKISNLEIEFTRTTGDTSFILEIRRAEWASAQRNRHKIVK